MSEESSPIPTGERRLSTGGKAPVKLHVIYVVEPVPSHHDPSVPGFSAWEHTEHWDSDKHSDASRTVEDVPAGVTRPRWSFQIYDTTPGSDAAGHLKAVAKVLHRDTWDHRTVYGEGEPDRLDVWGLPMEDGAGEEERVERCREHAIGEAAARVRAGFEGWEVPDSEGYYYEETKRKRKVIIVIDRPREEWDEGDGGFLVAAWEARPDYGMYMRGGRGARGVVGQV